MIRAFLVVFSLVLVLVAAPAAQDVYVRQARVELADIARSAIGVGLELTHEVVTGSLPENRRDTIQLQLRGGRAYAIAATCDEDCSDIDLVLLDPSGAVVSRDLAGDDRPVVTATPVFSGSYRLRVIMASCSREPCRYAVGVFGQ